MKKNTAKTFDLIFMIVTSIVMVAIMCFTLGGDKSVINAWKPEPRLGSDNKYLAEGAIVTADGEVDSIYVNIGTVYHSDNGKITLTLDWTNTESAIKGSNFIAFQRKVFTIDITSGSGYKWIKLGEKLAINYKYFKFTTKQSFDFCEVAFTDKDGALIPLTYYGGLEWAGSDYKFVAAGKEKEGSTLSKIADEQNAVSLSSGKFNAPVDKEADMMNAVDNFLSGKGYFVTDSADAFGVELISLGALIFGLTPFGIRIIPFLFTLFTLWLLYFFAKKLFKSQIYGVFAVILYALVGIGLSVGGLGVCNNIAVFFLLAAFYYAYDFFVSGISHKNVFLSVRPVLISGIAFALAIACDFTLFPVALGLAALYIAKAVKSVKAYKVRYAEAFGLEKEYAREKYVRVSKAAIVAPIAAYIVFAVIVQCVAYGVAYSTYGTYFNGGFFSVIAKSHAAQLSQSGSSLVWSWLIGTGNSNIATAVATGKTVSNLYLLANPFLSAFMSACFIAACALYIYAGNKNAPEILKENAKKYKNAFFVLLAAFVSALIFPIIKLGNADFFGYVSIACFLIPFALLLARLLEGVLSKKLFITLVSASLSVSLVFFAMGFACFFQLAIPEKVAVYLYNWMIV